MTKLLLKAYGFLTGGWVGYAIIVGIIFAAGAITGAFGQGLIDSPKISDLK